MQEARDELFQEFKAYATNEEKKAFKLPDYKVDIFDWNKPDRRQLVTS